MSIATDNLMQFLEEIRARVRRDLPGVLGEACHEILDDAEEVLAEVVAEWREIVAENERLHAIVEEFGEIDDEWED